MIEDINGVKRKEWDSKEEQRAEGVASKRECDGMQQRGERSDETERRE